MPPKRKKARTPRVAPTIDPIKLVGTALLGAIKSISGKSATLEAYGRFGSDGRLRPFLPMVTAVWAFTHHQHCPAVGTVVRFQMPALGVAMDVERYGCRILKVPEFEISVGSVRRRLLVETGARVLIQVTPRYLVGPYTCGQVSSRKTEFDPVFKSALYYPVKIFKEHDEYFSNGSFSCILSAPREADGTRERPTPTLETPPEPMYDVASVANAVASEPVMNNPRGEEGGFVRFRLLPIARHLASERTSLMDALALHVVLLSSPLALVPHIGYVRAYKIALGQSAVLRLLPVSPAWLSFHDVIEAGMGDLLRESHAQPDQLFLAYFDHANRSLIDLWFRHFQQAADGIVDELPGRYTWPENLRIVFSLGDGSLVWPQDSESLKSFVRVPGTETTPPCPTIDYAKEIPAPVPQWSSWAPARLLGRQNIEDHLGDHFHRLTNADEADALTRVCVETLQRGRLR